MRVISQLRISGKITRIQKIAIIFPREVFIHLKKEKTKKTKKKSLNVRTWEAKKIMVTNSQEKEVKMVKAWNYRKITRHKFSVMKNRSLIKLISDRVIVGLYYSLNKTISLTLRTATNKCHHKTS